MTKELLNKHNSIYFYILYLITYDERIMDETSFNIFL